MDHESREVAEARKGEKTKFLLRGVAPSREVLSAGPQDKVAGLPEEIQETRKPRETFCFPGLSGVDQWAILDLNQ
jgi:hypothetical protein